jgi:multidrug efflux pump subunit AcrB
VFWGADGAKHGVALGTAKIGQSEYDILTTLLRTRRGTEQHPIKQVDGATIYMRDVATVSDGFQVQTKYRSPGWASRRAGVDFEGRQCFHSQCGQGCPRHAAIRREPRSAAASAAPLSDQLVFVRSAVTGVIREIIIAAALTGIDDLVVFWELAKYDYHRDFDTVVDS